MERLDMTARPHGMAGRLHSVCPCAQGRFWARRRLMGLCRNMLAKGAYQLIFIPPVGVVVLERGDYLIDQININLVGFGRGRLKTPTLHRLCQIRKLRMDAPGHGCRPCAWVPKIRQVPLYRTFYAS